MRNNKKMKIAVFHNQHNGGAKRSLYYFIQFLRNNGWEIDLFIPSTAAHEDSLTIKRLVNKIKIYPVKTTLLGIIYSIIKYFPPLNISFRDLELTQKRIAQDINQGDYDFVYCEQDQFTISPFILKYLKIPTIYYCQQPLRYNEQIIQRLLTKISLKYPKPIWWFYKKYIASRLPKIDYKNASFSKYILTNSYFSRESILKSYGFNARVSYLGVDTKMFRSIPRTRKENFIFSIGTCHPSKGFDFIINSLKYISKKQRPKLVIASNNIYPKWKKYLERLARENNVNLEIKINISNMELVKLYNQAKIVVYTPYLEPFGLVPLEAMACGTPIIGIKEGGVRESIVHNKTGILVERDEKELANAIIDLIFNNKKQKELVKNAHQQIKSFWALEKAGERLISNINSLLFF